MDELLTRPDADAPSDEALLRAYVERGDREAMGRLLLRHHRAAWSLARSHGLAGSDADDAVQAAFVSALGAAGGFAGRSTVRSWLLGFVINACRNLARSQRRRRAHEGASPMPTPSAAPTSPPELIDALRAALAALPELYRVPLELRYLHGLEPGEVAETLRAAPATIRSRLARGLAQLREALASRRLALEDGALGAAIAALPTLTPTGGAPTLVAEWVRSGTMPAAKVSAAAGLPHAVKAIVAAVVIAAMAGGVALAIRRPPAPAPVVAAPAPRPTPPARISHVTPPGDDALEKRVSVRFAGDDLDEALKLIADATHLRCESPDPIKHLGNLTAAAEPMRLRELLDRRISTLASGLRWQYRDGTITVWRDAPDEQLSPILALARTGNDTETRCEAISALGRLADPRGYPTLFAATADHDPAVVEWAMRALRRHTETLRHGGGLDEFAQALVKSIVLPPAKPLFAERAPLDDHDRNLRSVRLLAATRSQHAIDTLHSALAHLPLRQIAWEGLCAIEDRRAEDAALAAYAAWRDRPKDRRPISAEMVLQIDPLVANRDLVLHADFDDADVTRHEIALEAACRWPDSRLYEALAAALAKATDDAQRHAIASALAAIRTPQALELSRTVPPAPYVDMLAVRAEQGDAAALKEALAGLADPDPQKRADALGRVFWRHRPEIGGPLYQLLRNATGDALPLAIQAATAADGEEAEPLAKLAGTLDPATKAGAAALEALAAARTAAALAALVARINHPQPQVRGLVVKSLARIHDAAAFAALVKLAGDGDANVRRTALEALDDERWPAADRAEVFLAHVGDGELNCMHSACTGLGRTGDPRAIPTLVAQVPRWPIGPDASEGLLRDPDPRATLALMPLLHAKEAQTRFDATAGWGMGRLMPVDDDGIDPRFTDDMFALTRDPDERVRWCAADALATLQPQGAFERLLAMRDDQGRHVHLNVGMSLMKFLPEPRAVAAVVPLLSDPDPFIRRTAIQYRLLDYCDDPLAQLLAAMKDESVEVREVAANAAGGHVDDQRVIAALRELAQDPAASVSQQAGFALRSAGIELPPAPAAPKPPVVKPAGDF